MTPYEAWTRQKPTVAHLREFGSDVWVLDESNNRSKLGPRSKKMKLTGFIEGSKSIRYYDAATRQIKVSRNFAFNENDELRELEIYIQTYRVYKSRGSKYRVATLKTLNPLTNLHTSRYQIQS